MKLAVLFPGAGYHVDKPLLYYAKDLAVSLGYEYISVEYGKLPDAIKGSKAKMQEAFLCALKNAMGLLSAVEWDKYGEITFISKSIGTAVAAETAHQLGLKTRNIYYTPLAETFSFPVQQGIAFHGTADGWVETPVLKKACEERGIPLYIAEGANHSLETEDILQNICLLSKIMRRTKAYLGGEAVKDGGGIL